MPITTQFGIGAESTYGTPVTVNRFFPFASESVQRETGRVQTKGRRTGQRVDRLDGRTPYTIGASGSVEMPLYGRGSGIWLKYLLGSVVTTGPVDTAYTHTATVGPMSSSFTAQVNRPFGAAGATNQPFTWSGGKVAKWELSCEAEGELTLKADLVFADESTVTSLATASYAANAECLTWVQAKATIATVDIPVTKWSVSCDNKLKTDRLFLRENTRRREPVEEDHREITVELECDWDDLSHYTRFASATQAGLTAEIIVTAKSITTIGVSTIPGLAINLPAVSFDEVGANVDGPGVMAQKIKGLAVDAGAGAITMAYVTADATP